MKDTIIDMEDGTRYTFLNAPRYIIEEYAHASLEDLAECCTLPGETPHGVLERARIELLIRMLAL